MKYHLTEANVKDLIAWLRAGHVDRAYKAIENLLPAEAPQDVEEFIAAHTIKIEIFHEPTIVCKPDNLRAWMAGHARVQESIKQDADRYAWLKNHVCERPTHSSMMNEFSENKTEYVFPRLIAWADFCGQITLDEAIDLKIAAIAEKQAIIDNKEQKE